MSLLNTIHQRLSNVLGISGALLTICILLGCDPQVGPTSFDPNYRLIIPDTTVVSGAAEIDGLNSDAKWNDAFNLEMIDGVSVPGVIMEGVADATNLYLYFEIEENELSSTDMVAIALNPSSTATDNRLFLIKPCPTGTAGCPPTDDDLPVDINYFLDTNDDGTWEPTTTPAGVVVNSATSGGIVWTVEILIPRGAPFNLPATAYFGLYTNILETSAFNIAAQYTWPFNNDAGNTLIFGTPEDAPAAAIWGNATLDTSIGNGVRISSSDISTNHGPSTISSDEPNTFYATAHNNTVTGGSLVTAEDVRATIRWANFGLPSYSSFQKIPTDIAPAPGNPTAYQDILPTASATYTLDWTVPAADQAFFQANAHWCIKVELESSNVNTVFERQQAQANMNFAETSSPFVRMPTIDTLGLRLPEKLKLHEYIVEERFYNFKPELKWVTELGGIEKIADSRYFFKVPAKEALVFDLSVLPPEESLVPFDQVALHLSSNTSGEVSTKLAVRPGTLITLIADQTRLKNAAAISVVDDAAAVTHSTLSTVTADTDIEKKPESSNDQRRSSAPAIYASWDGFEKSRFFVGNSVSLKVPEGVDALHLAAVASKETVGAMLVRTYTTDIEDYHLNANRSLKLNRFPNGIVNIGANLPTVIYRGKRNMGKTITIDKKEFTVYQSAGAFGYIVKGKAVQ